MSAFIDRLHSFFSKFFEVSKADLAEFEAAVEAHVQPLIVATREDVMTELATVEAELKNRLTALEAEVAKLLTKKTRVAKSAATES